LFERGDIAIAVWYTDRTGAAAAKGVPVAAAYPKEGAIGIVPTVSVPKASQRRDLAQKYIAVLLSPEGQLCFAQSHFAGPTNKTVDLRPRRRGPVLAVPLVQQITFPDTVRVAKRFPDGPGGWGRGIARCPRGGAAGAGRSERRPAGALGAPAPKVVRCRD